MRSLLLLLALLSVVEWALAQSHSRPDPADPRAPATTPPYQSAFPDYKPFVAQKNSWKQVNQEVADSPAMGSMQHKPGMTMPGTDKPAAGAAKSKEGAGGHDMGSMQHMPGMTTPGADKKAATAPMSKEGHDTMAMAKPQTTPGQPANAQTGRITGTGSVQLIDKVNGRVKLTHDPIAVMGWPKMTMFFRLKESSLADQLKEGDRVEFSLEKSASGYVISGFRKPISGSDPARKPAGHAEH